MQISICLENCGTLDEVIDLINTDGSSEFSREEIAAQYAYQAALENNEGMPDEELEAHLDFLHDEGANFNFKEALGIVISFMSNERKNKENPC